MDEIIKRIEHLPVELERKIWKDVHGFEMYKINQKIKYEANMFGKDYLNDSSLYEYWFQLGLKELPKDCWKKISNRHKRYGDNYRWYIFEKTGEPHYEQY